MDQDFRILKCIPSWLDLDIDRTELRTTNHNYKAIFSYMPGLLKVFVFLLYMYILSIIIYIYKFICEPNDTYTHYLAPVTNIISNVLYHTIFYVVKVPISLMYIYNDIIKFKCKFIDLKVLTIHWIYKLNTNFYNKKYRTNLNYLFSIYQMYSKSLVVSNVRRNGIYLISSAQISFLCNSLAILLKLPLVESNIYVHFHISILVLHENVDRLGEYHVKLEYLDTHVILSKVNVLFLEVSINNPVTNMVMRIKHHSRIIATFDNIKNRSIYMYTCTLCIQVVDTKLIYMTIITNPSEMLHIAIKCVFGLKKTFTRNYILYNISYISRTVNCKLFVIEI